MNSERFSENHSEAWSYQGKEFIVEVKRWAKYRHHLEGLGNCWNVYAHVFRGHPLFKELTEGGYLDSLDDESYRYINYNQKGEATKILVGNDYAHCGQSAFEGYNDPEQAREVFKRAEEVFEELNKKIEV